MPIARKAASPRPEWLGAWLVWLGLAGPLAGETSPAPARSPFAGLDLPDAWEERFWADAGVQALLKLEPKALADLVPVQAGLKFCRCPRCDAREADDPLAWEPAKPGVLTCRRCGLIVPNDQFPAKDEKEKKVPEETIEVLPGTVHKYPYHVVDPLREAYPGERLYLAAKRDYEARGFLAKAACYAAVRHSEQAPDARDPALARLASVLLLRFAQVYPGYAVHFDQPGQPKFFQQANLAAPFRRGYRTAKWDWSGCLDVPMDLVIAYALIRDDPALIEAGRILGIPRPASTIERRLFRASAEFVRRQPDEVQEMSLYAYRGLLAVGRLLDDPALVGEAEAKLLAFGARGFYHDGLWREGDSTAHRRVVAQLDGWIARLWAGGPETIPMRALARSAGDAGLVGPESPEVQQASWPAPASRPPGRRPTLLGGAGVARLAVGRGDDALDLELKGLGDFGAHHFNRLALRLAVGGRSVLADLDDLPPSADGWERSTASHNTVVIDGLNQRESTRQALEVAPGADIKFFAADPDLQVATLQDRHAYPQSASLYRRTVVAVAGRKARYAVGVFEVEGGLQHDQLFHAAVGVSARWQASVATEPGPASLLPPSIRYLTTARVSDGRWFVQAYGAFDRLSSGMVDRPSQAVLASPGAPGVRLHFFGETPLTLYSGLSPDPQSSPESGDDPGRALLLLRRRAEGGATLKTTFVTLFEPLGAMPALVRAGRVASPTGTVVLYVETADGPEHLVVNLRPGTAQTVRLADGRALTTDGLVVRVASSTLMLAGGTFAEADGRGVRQSRASGTILGVARRSSAESRGWFETGEPVADPQTLVGRALLIRHGDGTTRGWTLVRVENTPEGRARLYVREEPGFRLDPGSGEALYDQFPNQRMPGPHRYRVSKMMRDG